MLSIAQSSTSHGAQIPQLIGRSELNAYLALSINSNLAVNELYVATITTIISGTDEETDSIGNIEFSKSINYQSMMTVILYQSIIL